MNFRKIHSDTEKKTPVLEHMIAAESLNRHEESRREKKKRRMTIFLYGI